MSEQDAADAEQADDPAAAGTETEAETERADVDETGTEISDDGDVGDASDDLDDALDDVLDEGVEEPDLDDVDDALVDRVAESDPESVARELAALRVRVDGLESQLGARDDELDDLRSKLKRKQADFQNYKKRMEKRREQEKQRATEDLVERLLDVRDNLSRALDQDDADAESVLEGVESTLRQFDRVLDDENVDVVDPEPGEDVDPHTHEVLMRVESDQPEDTIADVHRPGYVMADKVLRPAQVTVSQSGGE